MTCRLSLPLEQMPPVPSRSKAFSLEGITWWLPLTKLGREWIDGGSASKTVKARFKFVWADYSEKLKKFSGSLTRMQRDDTGDPRKGLLQARKIPQRSVQIGLRNAFSGKQCSTVSDNRREVLV